MVGLTICAWLRWSCTSSIKTWSSPSFSLPTVSTTWVRGNPSGCPGPSHSITWSSLSSQWCYEQCSKSTWMLSPIKKHFNNWARDPTQTLCFTHIIPKCTSSASRTVCLRGCYFSNGSRWGCCRGLFVWWSPSTPWTEWRIPAATIPMRLGSIFQSFRPTQVWSSSLRWNWPLMLGIGTACSFLDFWFHPWARIFYTARCRTSFPFQWHCTTSPK